MLRIKVLKELLTVNRYRITDHKQTIEIQLIPTRAGDARPVCAQI